MIIQKAFLHDFNEFKVYVMDLDFRLSSVITQAFEDCNSLTSIFKVKYFNYIYIKKSLYRYKNIKKIFFYKIKKLIIMLGSLLERKKIRNDFESHFNKLISLVDNEMDTVKKLFDIQKTLKDDTDEIVVQRNMPKVAGTLKWCQELKDRATVPFESMKKLDYRIFDMNSEKIERIEKKYKELLMLIDGFSSDVYNEWCIQVGELSNDNLKKKFNN